MNPARERLGCAFKGRSWEKLADGFEVIFAL